MFDKEDDTYEINEAYILKYLDDIIKDESLVIEEVWNLLTIFKYLDPKPSQIPVIVDKCKAVDKGENVCDYAFNAYRCFYNETHDRPEIIDNSETTFDSVSQADVDAQNIASSTLEDPEDPDDPTDEDELSSEPIETSESEFKLDWLKF